MIGKEEIKFLFPDPLPPSWVVEIMSLKGSEPASWSVKGGGGAGTARIPVMNLPNIGLMSQDLGVFISH